MYQQKKYFRGGVEMKRNKYSGITLSLLLVLFVGLKLAGIISWSWWWVLSPIWMPLLLIGFILVLICVIYKSKKK